MGKSTGSFVKKMLLFIVAEIISLKEFIKFPADVMIGREPSMAHVCWLFRKKHIAFTDTEHADLVNTLLYPFSNVICTPHCYKKEVNEKKHIIYNGYQELTYLNPEYYTPNKDISNILKGVNEKVIVVRFVAWEGSHDIGHHGINNKMNLLTQLETYGRVIIVSEGDVPSEFTKYKFDIKPENAHDLLHSAILYIGEGATMAVEAAILGTPAIYISSLAHNLGYIDELEEKYDLLYSFEDSEKAIDKALNLLERSDLKDEWKIKSQKMIEDKDDVTEFVVNLIENTGKK
jgi:hypothetical protein